MLLSKVTMVIIYKTDLHRIKCSGGTAISGINYYIDCVGKANFMAFSIGWH